MTIIKNFKAIRPNFEYARHVAALPYDVYNPKEAKEAVKDKPYSFLHVDRSEVDLPEDTDVYSDIVYHRAASNLNNLIRENILTKDEQSCLYLYRLTMHGRSQTGLVCCSAIDDYLKGVIKKHELTREDKELDRIQHVHFCNANTGPIFLTYPSQKKINVLIQNWIQQHPKLYDFTSEDKIQHECWKIDDMEVIHILIALFNNVEHTYIADGHHRTASAVKVGLMRRKSHPDYKGDEEFNYFLSVLFPHDELYIMDYNRVVKDLNGLSQEKFIQRINEVYVVEKIGKNQYQPQTKGTLGMFLNDTWYKLSIRPNQLNGKDSVQSLDVSILQDEVLTPILGIKDIRSDNRIDFVGGIRGLDALEKRCQEDMNLAFAMYPTSIEELMKISDENKLMPPKSTWFEPKLRSGLFIHKLGE
ncbi:MAG: DUF1015 domain-containing protein [Eubacteriales bacterium]